ncbi:MAG: GAF domain-containing protein [Oscillatoriales cyanobacterium]|nr:MAG: GAF domain-containing protein [Oscillatoriales cyanobacterium]
MESSLGSQRAMQANLLMSITGRIRQSLNLPEILDATVEEVRAFLETDRVKIYQFSAEGHGTVVAESLNPTQLPSLKGLHFPADDIPPYARELFVQARQRVVADVSTCQTSLSPLERSESGQTLYKSSLRYRSLDPCHLEYLRAMGVQSSTIVPIVLDNTGLDAQSSERFANQYLWGLLASHHATPRKVSEEELHFVQAVVDQLEIAISQSILLQEIADQGAQEAGINRVTTLLHTAPTSQLQAALEETVRIFQGCGGRLCLWPADHTGRRELYMVGDQPMPLANHDGRPFEENLLIREFLKSGLPAPASRSPVLSSHELTAPWSVGWMRSVYQLNPPLPSDVDMGSRTWAIRDIYQEPLLRSVSIYFQNTSIRGLMLVPLIYGRELLGCLSVFREEVTTDELWTGWHDPDTRQLMARQSFEVWRQITIGQAQAWTSAEIKLAKALGERFSTAVKQHWLYLEVSTLNTSLETQVQERTAELRLSNAELQASSQRLQQAIDQQRALARLIASIRESLDIDMIFQTTVREVRQLLQADRVVVFGFSTVTTAELPDYGHGQIVAEDKLPNWLSLRDLIVDDPCFATHHVVKYQSGYIHTIADVTEELALDDCYREMLAAWQVKASLVLPIVLGKHLWGLMGIHQCSQSRQWQGAEVDFLRQVCAQLGVALKHAHLLQTTRSQANEIAQTLRELEQTQIHLVQREKMSLLGELVAGIAHELNNPIGFIYSNLGPITDYSTTLIELARLYADRASPKVIETYLESTNIEFIANDFPRLIDSMYIGSNRIREIISALKGFSRVDRTSMSSLDLQESLESTLMILQHHIKSVGRHPEIRIVRDYAAISPVQCYSGQIHQVLMNLISNAIDALREQQDWQRGQSMPMSDGCITLRLRQLNPDHVQVSIHDNGPGIDEAIKDRLFDPFFTTKPLGKGTGLGLSISRQIVERHQGSLTCISHPEAGTEFVLLLPTNPTPTPDGLAAAVTNAIQLHS